MPMMTQGSIAQLEKIPTQVLPLSVDVNKVVASEIAQLIRTRQAEGKLCVLGLATGSTPIGVYAELIRMHKEEGLSFKNVMTFNLDEYFPMAPHQLQSYHRFMDERLFNHIDIPRENINVPDGTLSIEEVWDYCKAYEKKIRSVGGLDIQVLGIGRTGHIGFNEPGSGMDSRTRLITLDSLTRMDAADDFHALENVPIRAITMGVGTIMDARRLIMIAFGEGKAGIVARAVEGEITPVVAASFLQKHPNAQVMLDEAAAQQLTRYRRPWLVSQIKWTPKIIKRAVIDLAKSLEKAILKLTEEDYNEGGLQDLLAVGGSAYDINIDVFRSVYKTITGWPGGKPAKHKRQGDMQRASDDIFPKRVLLFSPHPDDDVISMGGTFQRLVDHGHGVHVAYQVSGNIAVSDEDAARFADFAQEYNAMFNIANDQSTKVDQVVEQSLTNNKSGQGDSAEVRTLKGLIRRSEARAGALYVGVPYENMHFMDLPFYETGTIAKKPISDDDIQITVDLLNQIKPHQIYAAGDLSDPHGTHRVCLSCILQAIERIKDQDWYQNCELWLYRGAWQEWDIEDVEMAVPLAPREVIKKRIAILKHESQKDGAMFPGSDMREFWQRAEQRNADTAKLYDMLGLPEYEAIEGFVKWDGTMY